VAGELHREPPIARQFVRLSAADGEPTLGALPRFRSQPVLRCILKVFRLAALALFDVVRPGGKGLHSGAGGVLRCP
jgi:hypothetical protein